MLPEVLIMADGMLLLGNHSIETIEFLILVVHLRVIVLKNLIHEICDLICVPML